MKCLCNWKGGERVDNKKCPVHHPKKKRQLKCICEWEDGKRIHNSDCPVHKDLVLISTPSTIPTVKEQREAVRGMGKAEALRYAKSIAPKPKDKPPEERCPKCANSYLLSHIYMRNRKTGEPLFGKQEFKCGHCGSRKMLTFDDEGKVIDVELIKDEVPKVRK